MLTTQLSRAVGRAIVQVYRLTLPFHSCGDRDTQLPSQAKMWQWWRQSSYNSDQAMHTGENLTFRIKHHRNPQLESAAALAVRHCRAHQQAESGMLLIFSCWKQPWFVEADGDFSAFKGKRPPQPSDGIYKQFNGRRNTRLWKENHWLHSHVLLGACQDCFVTRRTGFNKNLISHPHFSTPAKLKQQLQNPLEWLR